VIGILAPTVVFAQPITVQAKSALYWVDGTLILTVVENGDTEEPSLVSIEIRDAANVVRASTLNRTLVLGRPVILSATVPAGLRQQLSATVTIGIQSTPEIHVTTLSMELVNTTSLTIRTLPPCAVPIEQMPSWGGGAEGNCGGGFHRPA